MCICLCSPRPQSHGLVAMSSLPDITYSCHLYLEFSCLERLECNQDDSCLGFLEKLERSPCFQPASSVPFHPMGNTEPSLCSPHPKGERLVKLGLPAAPRRRGVAVLCEGENALEPASKKTKLEELTISEMSSRKPGLSCTYPEELLTDGDSSWNNEAHEERQVAENPRELPPLEGGPGPRRPKGWWPQRAASGAWPAAGSSPPLRPSGSMCRVGSVRARAAAFSMLP